MIKKISLIKTLKILGLLFLVMTAPLLGQSVQFENRTIAKIEVSNGDEIADECFDADVILSRMKTRQGSFFSQADFDRDLKVLAKEFDRVEPSVEVMEDKVFIYLKVWAKPIIRSIRWNGNCKIDSKTLLKELGITLQTVFDRPEFTKSFQKLKVYYVKEGFFEAELDYTVTRDPLCNEVDIDINICEGRTGRIQKIVFHNFTCEEEKELVELMVTKEWNIFTSWLTDKGTYNEEAIQHDQFSILNYLQNEGYADADVDLKVVESNCKNRIIIHITAERGELYTVGTINIGETCLFSEEDIRGFFTFEEGDPYSPEAIRATAVNISELYGRRGYIDAVVDYVPSQECDNQVYNLQFTIEEGEQYRVGLIKVFGNCSTQTNVILHETLVIPGEIFNIEKLKLTEERLLKMRYFKTVNVYAVNVGDGSCLGGNYRDVHIEVEEGRTGNVAFSFGFSSVDSIFGSFNISENNFNIAGLRTLRTKGMSGLRGGGEYAFFDLMVGRKNTRYVLSWTKPYFMDTQWSLGVDLERSFNRAISHDYSIDAWGASIHTHRELNAFLRLGWNYRFRDSHVHVSSDEKDDKELNKEARIDGVISATGVSLSYDSTQDIMRPREGIRSVLSTQIAGLGGRHRFWRVDYINTLYFLMGEKGILKYRGDMRFLVPIGQKPASIPLDERLFFGGDSVLRGFRPYAVGPTFPNGDPRGGMSSLFLSMEYSYPLFERLDAFAFIDAGHLSFNVWEVIGNLKTSVGYGVRVKIIDGGPALIFGMGYPLNAHRKREIQRFFFSMGGNF